MKHPEYDYTILCRDTTIETVDKTIKENPNEKSLDVLMRIAMKICRGTCNPKKIQEELIKRLAGK